MDRHLERIAGIRIRTRSSRFRRGIVAAIAIGLVVLAGTLSATWIRASRNARAGSFLAAGLSAVRDGDLSRARGMIRELRAAGRADEAAIMQSSILIAKGLWEAAAFCLDRVPRGRFDTPKTLLLAEIAHRRHRHREVADLLLPLVERHPDEVDAHRLLAASFYDTGAVTETLDHLHQVARLAPRDPRPHRLLGLMHNDFERFGEAIPLYEESLRRDPDQPDRDAVLLELATCLAAQRRHADALAALDRRKAASPDGDVLRAECLLALGDRASARRLLDDVLAAPAADSPGATAVNRKALVLLGSLHLEDGDATEAIAVLERAAEDRHDYLAHLTLSRALAAAARETEAESARSHAESIRERRAAFADLHREAWEHPWDDGVRSRLADAAASLGRPDLERVWRSAAEGVRAAAAVPGDPASRDGKASGEPTP